MLLVGHLTASQEIPPSLKARITTLKDEKLKFYNNDTTCRFHSVDALKNEEKRLFSDILDARGHSVQERIKALRRKLECPQERRIRLDGTIETAPPHQMNIDAARDRKTIEDLTLELAQTEASRKALSTDREVPFVWDIAFVEIFEGENEGFDIVMGNPPYVRQESITAPVVHGAQVTDDKKEYKAKLALSVYQAFPHFFGYKAGTKTAAHKINAKSDLYIYFYLHGLSLLNSKGSFCFITSNSWLDVGYGADLQEFLLKHSQVKLVLDNQVKRSFANADVNSIIALFSAPDDRREWALDKTARFVMFRVPFEHILSPVIFDEIEEATERKATKEYRVFPIQQGKLLEDGCEIPEQEEETGKAAGTLIKTTRYIGNKWGGKYLRAPDIYWTILEKAKEQLVKLATLCTVEGYIHDNNTGVKYPKVPFLKTVKDMEQICVRKNSPCVFSYGVKASGNSRTTAPILFPRTFGSRHLVAYNPDRVFAKEFYKIIPKQNDMTISIAAQLNSSFAILQRELIGLVNLGDGALKFSADDVKIFHISTRCLSSSVSLAFGKLSQRTLHDVPEEIREEDRRTLDSIIFDVLALTQGERDAVYEAVINLVESRLSKAGSV